jgi:hypothetical protein
MKVLASSNYVVNKRLKQPAYFFVCDSRSYNVQHARAYGKDGFKSQQIMWHDSLTEASITFFIARLLLIL